MKAFRIITILLVHQNWKMEFAKANVVKSNNHLFTVLVGKQIVKIMFLSINNNFSFDEFDTSPHTTS